MKTTRTSRAAEFITDLSRFSTYCGIPSRVALPWSSRVRTRDAASDWNMGLETDRRTLCSTAKQPETVFVTYDLIETSASMGIDTEVTDDSGWHNFVVANSKWRLWQLMRTSTSSRPQNLGLCSVQLEPI